MTNQNTVRIQLLPTYAQSNPVGYIDVDPGTQFVIDYNVADIKDPSQRKANRSYQFAVVGTKEVNRLMNNYYNINVQNIDNNLAFSVNKRQACCIIRNGVIILDNAYMQLLSVDRISQNQPYSEQNIIYNVLVGDDATDFYTAITNKKLTDLDFSDMDRTYSSTNVLASDANGGIRTGAGV